MARRPTRRSAREASGCKNSILDTAAYVASVYGKVYPPGSREAARRREPRQWHRCPEALDLCATFHHKSFRVSEKWEEQENFRPCCRRSEMHVFGGSALGCARSSARLLSPRLSGTDFLALLFPRPIGSVVMARVRLESRVVSPPKKGVPSTGGVAHRS